MKHYLAEKAYVFDDARLMAEWDWEENEKCEIDPQKITLGSKKRANWVCAKGHKWVASVVDRTGKNLGCPYCSNKRILPGYNDLQSQRPDLMEDWDYAKNNAIGIFPDRIAEKSGKKVWWICKSGHSYQTSPYYRTYRGGGCPYCSHQKLLEGFNDLESRYPEVLAEWDYEKDLVQPSQIMARTMKKVWWKCKSGHSYLMRTADKTNGQGCPICAMATHTSFPEQAILFYIKKVYPDAINAYREFKVELDIFIPSINTAIEYDGYRAHKDKQKKIYKKMSYVEKRVLD